MPNTLKSSINTMSGYDSEQIALARALANPTDKDIRDSSVNELAKLLSRVKSMDDLEMLKLWKALYYCMWLSDKAEVQKELATTLSSLLRVFKKTSMSVKFFRMFCRTLLREWSVLDQHRINKFYIFFRSMIREMFVYFVNHDWNEKSVSSFLEALSTEILEKTPNGLRFHCADLYIDELYIATQGNITTSQFIGCIQPFLFAIKNTTDQIFHDRIATGLFHKYLSKYAAENRNNSAQDQPATLFANVATTATQALVFDIAGSEDISETNRKKVYKIHAEFQGVTKQTFVETSLIEGIVEQERVEPIQTKNSESKKLKINNITPFKNSEQQLPGDKKKRKRETEESTEDEPNTKKANEQIVEKKTPLPTPVEGKNKLLKQPESNAKAETSQQQTKKTISTTPSKLNEPELTGIKPKEVMKIPVGKPSTSVDENVAAVQEKPKYIASAKYSGSREGYVFKKGISGVGYYVDTYVPRSNVFKTKPILSKPSSSSNSKEKKTLKWRT